MKHQDVDPPIYIIVFLVCMVPAVLLYLLGSTFAIAGVVLGLCVIAAFIRGLLPKH